MSALPPGADISVGVRNFAGISIGPCGGDRSALPRLARSGFILRSPRLVSRKREFSWIRLETFGNVRPKKFEHRSPETFGDEKSPRLAGLSCPKKEILRNAGCVAGVAVLIAPVSRQIPC